MITIVIPARNEESMIAEVIRGIKKSVKERYELFVIDDASTDGTAKVAKSMGAKVIRHGSPQGGVFAKDLDFFKGRFIISLDSDMEHDPKDIPRFIEALESYDLVLGTRDRFSRFIEPLLQKLFRLPTSDFFTGFVGFRRVWIPALQKHDCRLWQESFFAIHALGGTVRGIPIHSPPATRPSRFGGTLKSNLKELVFFQRYYRHGKRIKKGVCHR